MISVNFTSDVENVVATEHLYQWDNGQKLKISGVGTNADIHFANKKSEKALVVTPTVTSGALVAPIPNSLLTEPYPILAYVYVPSDDGSKTIKSVTIYVEARKQPSDFVLEDDIGVTTLESISQRANAIMSSIQSDYNNFKSTIQSELDEMKNTTTVPNADTLDGKHASDFMQNLGKLTTGSLLDYVLTMTNSGYLLVQNGVTDTPVSGQFFFVDVRRSASGDYAITATRFNAGGVYTNRYNSGAKKWYGWANVADGGNANTAKTANSVNGVTFLVGTATPQVTDSSAEGYVPEGAWYGQYA